MGDQDPHHLDHHLQQLQHGLPMDVVLHSGKEMAIAMMTTIMPNVNMMVVTAVTIIWMDGICTAPNVNARNQTQLHNHALMIGQSANVKKSWNKENVAKSILPGDARRLVVFADV